MQIQKTVKAFEFGGLYLVATPIGNLDDITLRAIDTLKSVDYILAEDTRVTKKLCQHLGIEKQLVSFHEHNQYEKTKEIITEISLGKKIALVSDAGMPCISDPGAILVQQLIVAGLAVSVIPGVSASTALFTLSGMSEDGRFTFHGFLPTKEKAKHDVFKEYVNTEIPVIFYESPHRIIKTLQLLPEIFAESTKVCIGRELTKLYETLLWFTVGEVKALDLHALENLDTWKGEIAFIVYPQKIQKESLTDIEIYVLLEKLVMSGMKPKIAMKQIATELGQKPNDLYKIWEANKK